MREYRPYLDAEFRDDFDAYASEYEARMGGSRITPPKHFFNPKVIEPYEERMIASGAIDGEFDPAVRIDRLESDGIAAEIIFPNQGPFGIGFGPANVGAPDHAARRRACVQPVDRRLLRRPHRSPRRAGAPHVPRHRRGPRRPSTPPPRRG